MKKNKKKLKKINKYRIYNSRVVYHSTVHSLLHHSRTQSHSRQAGYVSLWQKKRMLFCCQMKIFTVGEVR